MRNKIRAVAALLRNLINRRTFSNIRNHWNLSMALSPFLEDKLISNSPYTIYLYPYISHSFNMQERVKVLIHHYTFLKNTYSPLQLKRLFVHGFECLNITERGAAFSITIGKNVISEYEGPISLFFKVNEDLISTMSFTFLPGYLFNSQCGNIIYISHLQRSKTPAINNDKFLQYFKNIHPSAILLKAIEAFALALNIKTCVAIAAGNQLNCRSEKDQEVFINTYDDFWKGRGAAYLNGNYFFDLPISDIPMTDIKQTHRNKTHRRRRQLSSVYDICYHNFCKFNQNKYEQ